MLHVKGLRLMSDKRQFQRISLSVVGTLAHHDVEIPVSITDISLQGVRLSACENDLEKLPFDSHDPYIARFQVNEDSPSICMEIEQLYRQDNDRSDRVTLGCKVAQMDVASISALRRLILLNGKNDAINDSDLNALIDAVYSKASSASLN
ncbi:hypothetical protein KUL49_22660 [Alteromonas sp. KUL49]|nr:hypothetical protein KUL49_22660 [Alteromonas sp. KUL49]